MNQHFLQDSLSLGNLHSNSMTHIFFLFNRWSIFYFSEPAFLQDMYLDRLWTTCRNLKMWHEYHRECLNIFFVSGFWELNPYSYLEKLRIQDHSPRSILLSLKMQNVYLRFLDFKKARFLVSRYLTNRSVGILF